ncbi:helix-turn-helix transcriptional regulator [Glaciihabitans sp. UYNi722]|uniref:helix-turn-helix transcriptional regulator n=1 Tax=Glaciihabitans sp. UYNi722 TaxID=3156344 RepID=UPI003393B308
METGSPLGEYLRARRELLTPEEAGLPGTGRRRVLGLRREEAAQLAGISSDHYLRLEQGLDLHPTDQVLDGLAMALQLDADATAHLHRLAHPTTGRRRADPGPEYVSPSLEYLVSSWTNQAAIVHGRHMNVLASNALAVALSPIYKVGANALRSALLDPGMQEFNRDWEGMTERIVAGLRATVGSETDDPQLAQLVGELSLRSERFRQLWAQQEVRPKAGGISLMQHPEVGALDLHYEKFSIEGTSGQVLVIFHAEPGTPSEVGLRRLARIAAGEQDDETPLPAPVSLESRRRAT